MQDRSQSFLTMPSSEKIDPRKSMKSQNSSNEFKENAENYRPWSELPNLILISITHYLNSLSDLMSFSHVCCHWRSSIPFSSIPPLLLCPPFLHTITVPSSHYKYYVPSIALEPESFMGFSHGHLIYHSSNKPILLNPLTKSSTELPCFTSEKDYSFAALTSPISSNRSALLVFTSSDVFRYVFMKRENLVWRSGRFARDICIASVVTLKDGRVFAVNDNANTVVEFLNSENHVICAKSFYAKGIDESMVFDKTHFGPKLVECGGDLLLVLFVQNEANGDTVKVNVYKLDLERKAWVRVERLTDYAIFIDCGSRCGYSCYRMERWEEMNDCLYLTGPGTESCSQFPIDGSVFPHHDGSETLVSSKWMRAPRWPSPFWILPL